MEYLLKQKDLEINELKNENNYLKKKENLENYLIDDEEFDIN